MQKLILEDTPERYLLGFDADMVSLLVQTSDHMVSQMVHVLHTHPDFTDQFEEELGLPEFISPESSIWGFGACLHMKRNEASGSVTWTCPYPPAIPSGGDTFPGEFPTKPDFKALYAMSASLHILFSLFEQCTSVTDSRLQLASVITPLRGTGIYGAPIFATISPYARKILTRMVSDESSEPFSERAHSVIAKTVAHLTGWSSDFAKKSTGARFLPDGRISFVTYGSATDLSTNPMQMDWPGLELGPHNTDNPCQQLSLLAGFAAFIELLAPAAHAE